MRQYDAVVIVDPNLEQSSIQQAVDKISQAIAAKGEVENIDQWGRRRMAFEINHQNEGYYLALRFKGAPELLEELDRMLNLGEEFIRHKIVRVS